MARVLTGVKDIPTAGSAVQLLASGTYHCYSIMIKAFPGNTGDVYYNGDSSASAANGFAIEPGKFKVLNPGLVPVDNNNFETILLSTIWLDTATNGNDVEFSAIYNN